MKKDFQAEKKVVLAFYNDFEKADDKNIEKILSKYVSSNYKWRGVYPFRKQNPSGVKEVCNVFWKPLLKSLKHIQRRQDIFIGGENEIDGTTWIFSMGTLRGLFDQEWLQMRPTGKIVNLRYADFNKVVDGKIVETGIFIDLIGFMYQVELNPLPPETGSSFVYPGPIDHNGLLFKDAPVKESQKTLDVMNKMIQDLDDLNKSGAMGCPPEILAKTWSDKMSWYGPGGIGASYTIARYQLQHQLPFRNNLKDKVFNGHVCRFAEGNFACFFGWPNLNNTPIGGFLGLPKSDNSEMQVVDVYYRRKDKLFENWVFIDIPWYLYKNGVDIIKRTVEIKNPKL